VNYLKNISIIFALFLFVNCSSNQQDQNGTVTITFWHSFVQSTIPALKDLVARFEEEHPNIKIRPQYIPTGEALVQKLITSIQSKTAPDVSWIHAHFIEDLVEAKAIYRMKEFIEGENGLTDEDLNDIYPSLLQYSSWRGVLYSLPMEATNLALLYNKDMFRAAGLDPEKPPENWEQLLSYAKQLTFDKDNDGKFEQVGYFVPIYPAAGPQSSWMVWQWKPYIWQAGGYIIDENQTKILYNSDAGIAALSLWKQLYNDLRLDVFTTDFDVAFASKHLAMAMDGPWNLPRYRKILKNIDWAFAPLPAGRAKKATIVGGEYLAIFKQTKHPKEAWQFIKWMIQPEIQAFWAMKSGYLPIRKAVLKVPEFQAYLKSHPNFRVFVEQMDYGQAERPIDYGNIEIQRHSADAIEKSTVGNQEVRQSLEESAKKSQETMESIKKQMASDH
jgi:ABC-type glycerol-3-phosphate transport system substrate-binding protein